MSFTTEVCRRLCVNDSKSTQTIFGKSPAIEWISEPTTMIERDDWIGNHWTEESSVMVDWTSQSRDLEQILDDPNTLRKE
ncbi:unnamed protein product [Caenorhabditis nigoni]